MSKLIIGIGGTGKSVSLVYLKLAKFFGVQNKVLIIDMPFGRESIDHQLNKEDVEQSDFITPWAGGAIGLNNATFAEIIGLKEGEIDQPVAHALFSNTELETLVEDGMNCRPIVGATIAMRKLWHPKADEHLTNLRQKIGQYKDIFLVSSITGGTGAGVGPSLARWLTEVCRKDVHGILLLPYADIGAGAGEGPNNAKQDENAYAALSYLEQLRNNNQSPFQDFAVIGLPDRANPASGTVTADHPLHILAATYIIYYDEFLRRTPEKQGGPFYLEVKADGLRESEIEPNRGQTFAHGIYNHLWYQNVLQKIANQKPDQSWDITVPPLVSNRLAWRALRESVRDISVASGGYNVRGRVWNEMRKLFRDEATSTKARIDHFEAITARDTNHIVYNINWDRLKQEAESTLKRAKKVAKTISKPNIDRVVDTRDSAVAASKDISNQIINKFVDLSRSISKRGEQQTTIQGSSTVFLPAGIHNPAGSDNIDRKPLTNFHALIQRYQGADEGVNMPDPQARRYQFVNLLEQALSRYIQRQTPNKEMWNADATLSQFMALLEGVIFGKLHIKLFDLSEFGFVSAPDRRVLGVLIDDAGNVHGGTDPDTLFFPSPDVWQDQNALLKRLSDENGPHREREEGILARSLIKKFRDSFDISVHKPLWYRALDEYLRLFTPPNLVDEFKLKEGWKQCGPITLRMPTKSVEEKYIPVYENKFTSLATSALSGNFAHQDNFIRLEVHNQEMGAIYYPQSVRAGLSQKQMGAGLINLSSSAGNSINAFEKIRYSELHQQCQGLIYSVNPSFHDIQIHPYNYPDAVRLPFLQDGFVAEYLLHGGVENGRYSRRFLDMMRGRGIALPPTPTPGHSYPHGIKNGDHYFVDVDGIIYVEKYQGKEVKELSLLGQALWMIFIGEVKKLQNTEDRFHDKSGNLVLECIGKRYLTGQLLTLEQPNEALKAADLRGISYYKAHENISELFREAIDTWLGYFNLNPLSASIARRRIDIGDNIWGQP